MSSVQRTPHQAFQEIYGRPAEKNERVDELRPEPGVSVVDVRDADAYARGHIPGATHADVVRQVDVFEKLARAPSGAKALVFVCYAGIRSGRVAKLATSKGFNATSIAGGMAAWKLAGLPVIAG